MADVEKPAISSEAENEEPEEPEKACVKLKPAEHLMATLNGNQELYRSAELVDCDPIILKQVFDNSLLLSNILKHLPWQDKFVCREVSTSWQSAVCKLGKKQLRQVDFSINLRASAVKKGIVFKKSGHIYNVPLCVLMFCNAAAINDYGTAKCMALLPHPCNPPCEKEHSVIDMIHRETAAPNPVMFITKAYNIGYLPLQRSLTWDNAILTLGPLKYPFYCGLVIPLIKDVQFTTYSTPSARSHAQDMQRVLKKIAEDSIIKAIIVNVTDHFMLYCDSGSDNFLDCVNEIQPDIPFALGGCLVEDTFAYQGDMDDIIAVANDELPQIITKQVSLAIFTNPKDAKEKPQFEVFSCVIEKSSWSKQQIQIEIEKFSKRIPHFANSMALKLSCAGRQNKHDYEQDYFRECFPDTPIAGVFGNGEFGVDYPQPKQPENSAKKAKMQIAYDTLRSYTTVFMYFGWGKVVRPAQEGVLRV